MKKDEYVESLRASEDVYRDASAKEGEIWGKEFSDAARNAARAEDQAAARELGIARPSLFKLAAEHGWRFERGLSLACGSGRAERELIKRGICTSFVGIDIAEQALVEARRQVGGMDIAYRSGDLNLLELEPGAFDLVVTQNCLHHVLELEKLAEQIWRSLRPGGRLWIDDYVGESQFQWTDVRLQIVNDILGSLSPELRKSTITGRTVGPYARRAPGTLASPFEAIRSEEILPVFSKWFDVELRFESNSILHLVAPVGTRRGFADHGRDVFKLLQAVDRALIASGTLAPLSGQYVLRRRD